MEAEATAMSQAALTLHFHNQETLRDLERAAEALGVSMDELVEAAIERELAAVGADVGGEAMGLWLWGFPISRKLIEDLLKARGTRHNTANRAGDNRK